MKDCNSCGKCCIKYSNGGLSASAADLALWESFRPDIDRYVNEGEIWSDPETGSPIERCPWLKSEPVNAQTGQTKFTCAIYFDRPEDCRVYPARVSDMVNDDCEMLEAVDRANLRLAQIELDTKFRDD